MKRFAFLILAAASLCACAPAGSTIGGLPAAPADISETTVVDEKAALSVEIAYQAVALSVKAMAQTNIIMGTPAETIAALDRAAYAAVKAARAAYDAGNAESYREAEAIARDHIAALLRLVT
ncbi:MAG TPA: hypothetical protein VN152_09150 [Sphingopyxis sp.]|nr:hypothetical protein [Sphingopyxis sp.]